MFLFHLFTLNYRKVVCHLKLGVMLKVMWIQSHLFFQGRKHVHKNSPNNLDCSIFTFTNRHVHINQVTKILHCMSFKIMFFVWLILIWSISIKWQKIHFHSLIILCTKHSCRCLGHGHKKSCHLSLWSLGTKPLNQWSLQSKLHLWILGFG